MKHWSNEAEALFSGNVVCQRCFDELRGTGAYRVDREPENSDYITENNF